MKHRKAARSTNKPRIKLSDVPASLSARMEPKTLYESLPKGEFIVKIINGKVVSVRQK
jgi:hypothetical protein